MFSLAYLGWTHLLIALSLEKYYHTIYKYGFVKDGWAVCGCMRVCDTSLEPPWPPYEDMIGGNCLARAVRP